MPPLPPWLRSVAVFFAGLALGFAARRPAPMPPAPPGVASCPPPVVLSQSLPAPSAPALPSLSLAERAEKGELVALKSLEQQPEEERGTEGSLALARGHAVLALRDLQALVTAIRETPALAHDRSTLARLHAFLEREPILLDAIAQVATVPGPESMDLLYSTWRHHGHATAGLLARDLQRRKEALEQSSEALRQVVALEQLTEERPSRPSQHKRRCERVLTQLAEARQHGDRRWLPLLDHLEKKEGCGASGQEDCYPCLREGDALKNAREASKRREPPTPWILPRR